MIPTFLCAGLSLSVQESLGGIPPSPPGGEAIRVRTDAERSSAAGPSVPTPTSFRGWAGRRAGQRGDLAAAVVFPQPGGGEAPADVPGFHPVG